MGKKKKIILCIFLFINFLNVLLNNNSLCSSIAVQGFIKKLKLTGLAHSITSLLSKRFVELMTSEHGRYVVLQCIYTFGAKENEVIN
nr:hypothetical protein DM860_017489 [Ipomoea trifida]